MKTSKKLLMIIAGFVLGLLVAGLFVLRNDMQTILESNSVIRYEPISVENFETLDFSGNWTIRIRPGRTCKVELEILNDSVAAPRLENKNGIQYFINEHSGEARKTIHARVSVPILRTIKALKGTKIHMEDYPADSIWVILDDSCSFTGRNNQFKYISFKTSGEALVQISEILN